MVGGKFSIFRLLRGGPFRGEIRGGPFFFLGVWENSFVIMCVICPPLEKGENPLSREIIILFVPCFNCFSNHPKKFHFGGKVVYRLPKKILKRSNYFVFLSFHSSPSEEEVENV